MNQQQTGQQQQIPVYEPEEQTPDYQEEKQRLRAAFAEMESKQPEFFDDAARSIIERVLTLMAVLFVIIAFGDGFPPKYLVNNLLNKVLLISVLIGYLMAMGMGITALHLRSYKYYAYNMTQLRQEWQRMLSFKRFWVRCATALFALSTVALAVLIVLIILPL